MKVGDTVRIKSTSRFYGRKDETNPINIIGKITAIESWSLGVYVDWSNGYSNSYDVIDLEVVDSVNNNYSIY